jgi:sialate O-acetylesterase
MKKTLKSNLILLTVLFLSLAFVSNAEVKLPAVLTSNMVFQRDHAITVWGWAAKGEKVSVTFNKLVKKAKPDASGAWKVVFPAMQAGGGPLQLKVQGKNEITLDNILIGDVWVCSGQSNMEMALRSVNNADQEIAKADYPNIRLLQFPKNLQKEPVNDVEKASWTACSPQTVARFSAVAYFFGRYINKETNIPIGLIHTSWGGTNAEAWTSMDWLVKLPKYKDFPAELAERMKKTDSLSLAKMKQPNEVHSGLFNGMINPLLNLAVKGAIWYQGESNAYEGKLYQTMFPNMIDCWREKWHQPDMPFLYVQLANFTDELPEPGKSNWANLREAQLMTLNHPNTGMAVIIDIGDAKDIHPKNKQDVGYRLALNAMHLVYGKDIVYSGPIYKSMEVAGDKIAISFTQLGSGLMVKDKYGYPKAFAIAGADQTFYWAKAEIKGDKVVVWSDKVSNPLAVRYAWADNPGDANLYNKEGLPASPFRTDSW